MPGKLGVYGKGAGATPFVPPRHQPVQSFCRRLLAAGLTGLALIAGPAASQESSDAAPYRLGEGLAIPGTGLTLGGYATGIYEDMRHQPARTALDNVSLFVWWEGEGRWKFFSELDYENVLSTRNTGLEGDERYLALERLYFDYALTDTANVRVGKFLTPIGRWNLIHATPLVWTSSRPLVTLSTFPGNVTGLMVSGTLSSLGGTEYALYTSSGAEIRPNPTLDPFTEVVGGHLTLPAVGGAQLGFSYAAFEQKKTHDESKELLGVDFMWSKNRYEISAEGIYRFSDKGSAWDEKGAFVQAVVPLGEKLYAVGRYENFRQSRAAATTELWVTGLNYRITPAVVLKAEVIGGRNNNIGAPEGFMSSVSILF